MTDATIPAVAPTSAVTLRRAVRSELIRFRTLRSHLWLFGVSIGFLLVLGPVQALGSVVAGSGAAVEDGAGAVSTALAGGSTASLLLGVLGVLLVAGEYTPRLVRTTFMLLPQRRVVVVARSLMLGLLVAVAGSVAVAAAVTASLAVLSYGDARLSWASPDVLRVSLATVWHLVGWGVLGLAAGWVTRSKLGGTAVLMTLMLVLAPVLALVPGRAGEVVVALTPQSAGAAMVSTHPATAQVGGLTVDLPLFGFVLWTAYLALATVGAAALVTRRDA